MAQLAQDGLSSQCSIDPASLNSVMLDAMKTIFSNRNFHVVLQSMLWGQHRISRLD